MGGGWEDKVYRRVRGKMKARGKEYGRIIWTVYVYLARTSQELCKCGVWLTKPQLNVR
ncbi:hypothetical protein M405DRAFT_828909 [Rhizopogon salebrosus TDB-379]|nr:hypothetical protein M405DRAFT_828909 [Rhizopogon salebrosus TDB-379]